MKGREEREEESASYERVNGTGMERGKRSRVLIKGKWERDREEGKVWKDEENGS